MKRRDFIKNAGLASTALMIPSFLRSSSFSNLLSSRSGKTLVVIQLSGGNDGLNTIIPFEDDLYYNARPSLGIPKNEVVKLTDFQGFNPALSALRNIYDNGEISIVNSVGYPNPDRSHFRSMDIWHTASDSSEYLSTGWLGRYLDSECQSCKAYHALEMDDTLSLSLKGINTSGFAMSNPDRLKRATKNPFLKKVAEHNHDHDHEEVAYLYKTMIDTQSSADYLFEKSKVHQSKIEYPQTPFAKDLKQVAELMTADTDVKIYYVTLSGFDTHAGQKNTQNRLFKQYAEGVDAFVKDLKRNGLFDDTLLMTFSEFGRRVKQNAGGGTDHGTANNLFLMGGKLKKAGIYNDAPNLSDLDKGDLKYQVDFRNIYSNILTDWLDANPKQVLGQHFDSLRLI
ncbi:MAG: DUF1501 domain-containing protein [Saprospiraceae bacterium]